MSKSYKQEKSWNFKRESRQDSDNTFEKFVRPKKQFKKPHPVRETREISIGEM